MTARRRAQNAALGVIGISIIELAALFITIWAAATTPEVFWYAFAGYVMLTIAWWIQARRFNDAAKKMREEEGR